MSVRDPRHDEKLIADIRELHHRAPDRSMLLMPEEIGAVLDAITERDELRRQTVGDFEVGFAPVAAVVTVTPCPLAGTIHSCPLGGCANDAPRVTEIPDLPMGPLARPKLVDVTIASRYDRCHIADGCGADEVCAALCPRRGGA